MEPAAERERLTYLRNAFASLLVTGPFSILLGFEGGMMALNDRLKLRSMVVAEKGEHGLRRQRGMRHPRRWSRIPTGSAPPRAASR